MKKRVVCFLLFIVLLIGSLIPVNAATSVTPMYRLYNPNNGEHFYTASPGEKNGLVKVGWQYEGIGWYAPSKSNTPVYRLYNPNAGDHHYTMNKSERDGLLKIGWNDEGIGWYSDDKKGVPLYRQYNPNAVAGSHNYTTSKKENDWLVSLGWQAEGIGWYGVFYEGTHNDTAAWTLFDLINTKRKEKGLSALIMDKELFDAAKTRAKEVSTKFSYLRPNGKKGITITDGCKVKSVEEHIASRTSDPKVVLELWTKDNNFVEKDYVSVGIGCYVDKNQNYFWAIELSTTKGTSAKR